MATLANDVWVDLVRERKWWRRAATVERVGHCTTRAVSFLPAPCDVRVCVHTPHSNVLEEATGFILLETGDWFECELMFVRSCLEPNANAIDIGANHGVYCLSMASAVQKGGKVWAFEPSSDTADLLETSRNINAFQHLTVLREAVSHTPGTLQFSVGQGELNHLISEQDGAHVQTEEVSVTTLDICMD